MRQARPLRVAYLSGPSDADRIYDDLLSAKPASYFGTNYMRQFLLLMQELSANALIETWHGDRAYCRKIGPFVFCNVPHSNAAGLRYHFSQAAHLTGVLRRFLFFRPDVVVLTGKEEYWWLLAPLRWIGVRFIASFHCVIWPPFRPLKRHARLLRLLNRLLILRHLNAAVSTSQTISEQFASLAGSRAASIPVFSHLPTWDKRQFASITSADQLAPSPFKVIFMGRIETNKGVYDLVEIADQLRTERPGEFEFHLCGDGSELENIRENVARRELSDVVHIHGYCRPERLRTVMSACHAVVVPTRTDFAAGFEMTCAEAILSGRPLVTSAVAPAIDYLRPATVEVPPDDVAKYKAAIVELKDNPALYAEKLNSTGPLCGQFLDQSNSWDFAMRKALAHILPGRVDPKM